MNPQCVCRGDEDKNSSLNGAYAYFTRGFNEGRLIARRNYVTKLECPEKEIDNDRRTNRTTKSRSIRR